MPEPLRKPRRFNERKSAFVAAATRLINRKGVSGMSLADVTSELGMAPKAIAHYFKDKDDLAASCFLDAIGRMRACVAEAAHDDTPDARVLRFLRSYFALKARVPEGKGHELVAPNDIRALNNADVNADYAGLFRELRGLLDAWRDARHTAWQTAIRVVTTGILACLLVGAAIKLKLMGGSQ